MSSAHNRISQVRLSVRFCEYFYCAVNAQGEMRRVTTFATLPTLLGHYRSVPGGQDVDHPPCRYSSYYMRL